MASKSIIWWFAVLFWGALVPVQVSAQEGTPALVQAEEVSGNQIRAYLGLGDEASGVDEVWTKSRWQSAVKIADTLIETDKESYGGHAVKYLALLELKGDRMLATQAAVRATKDLAPSPKALGEFINRALYVRPRVNEYQLALMALVPLVPDARNVASVRVAHLRALVGCGKVKEAVATNRDIVKDLSGSAGDLLALVQGICEMKGGKPLGGIARQALDKVLETRERDLALRMLEYQILYQFEDKKKAAHDLGAKIIDEGAQSGSLNNWLWYLITKRSTAGRYPSLALQAARRLMKENPDRAELDTIALALYRNGMLDEALDFQERAVGGAGDGASPGMKRRLEIFRAEKAKRDKGKQKDKERVKDKE